MSTLAQPRTTTLDKNTTASPLTNKIFSSLFCLFLGLGCSGSHLAMRFALARMYANGTNRKRRQGLKDHVTLAVLCQITAPGMIIDIDHRRHRLSKTMNDLPATRLPIGTLEYDEKIVATDMSDKINA